MARKFTRREFTRTGLAAAAFAAPPWRSARAAGLAFHLGLVTYNVARDWDLDTMLRLCREARVRGRRVPDDARARRRAHARTGRRAPTVRAKCRDAGLRADEPRQRVRVPLARPGRVRQNVADCREWVLLAKDIGARAVKVRPNGLPKDVPEEKTLEQIGRALAECGALRRARTASRSGARSTATRRRCPRGCGGSWTRAATRAVGVTWNSNDTDVANGSVAESFALLRPFIRCCHITDIGVAPPPRRGRRRAVAPAAAPAGPPPYPYRELFARLAEAGFDRLHAVRVPAAGARRRAAPTGSGGTSERWEELRSSRTS